MTEAGIALALYLAFGLWWATCEQRRNGAKRFSVRTDVMMFIVLTFAWPPLAVWAFVLFCKFMWSRPND